jgi:hypothetical protein
MAVRMVALIGQFLSRKAIPPWGSSVNERPRETLQFETPA